MSDSENRFKAWTSADDEESGGDSSGYSERDGRRFAAVVYWRSHVIALTARRGVLELRERPEHTATLTNKRGEVVFTFPIGELRVRRRFSYCFTIECQGHRWLLWGIAVNSVPGAKRQLEVMKREHVFTIIPPPPGMDPKQYKRLMTSKRAQQKLWRELWLVGLKSFGAQRVD